MTSVRYSCEVVQYNAFPQSPIANQMTIGLQRRRMATSTEGLPLSFLQCFPDERKSI